MGAKKACRCGVGAKGRKGYNNFVDYLGSPGPDWDLGLEKNKTMSTGRKLRFIFILSIFFISLCILAWGLIPLGTESATVPFGPDDFQIPTPSGAFPILQYLV